TSFSGREALFSGRGALLAARDPSLLPGRGTLLPGRGTPLLPRAELAGALYGAPALRAATTPLPLNSAGLAVAAIVGRPLLTLARKSGLLFAVFSCCNWALVGSICFSTA